MGNRWSQWWLMLSARAIAFLWRPQEKNVHAQITLSWYDALGLVRLSKSLEGTFNPRTRAGCDLLHNRERRRAARFNPRTRAGCDQSTRVAARNDKSFNPRTRAGCDEMFSTSRYCA